MKILRILLVLLAVVALQPAPISAQVSGCIDLKSNLQVGSRGQDVILLQNYLTSVGQTTIADGAFGSKTKDAVVRFQTARGIKPTSGIVGSITRKAIKDATCGPAAQWTSQATAQQAAALPCQSGAVYNYMNGMPCQTQAAANFPCAPGALYNTVSGMPCGSSAATPSSAADITASQFLLQTRSDVVPASMSLERYQATTGLGCTATGVYSSYDGEPCILAMNAQYRVDNSSSGSSVTHNASSFNAAFVGDWESIYEPQSGAVVSSSESNKIAVVIMSHEVPQSLEGWGITQLFTPTVISYMVGQKTGSFASVSEIKIGNVVDGYSVSYTVNVGGKNLFVREYLVMHNGYLHDIITLTPDENVPYSFYQMYHTNFYFSR